MEDDDPLYDDYELTFWDLHGRKIIAGVIALVLVGIGVWWLMRDDGAPQYERRDSTAPVSDSTGKDVGTLTVISVGPNTGIEYRALKDKELSDVQLSFIEGECPAAGTIMPVNQGMAKPEESGVNGEFVIKKTQAKLAGKIVLVSRMPKFDQAQGAPPQPGFEAIGCGEIPK
jgi:hypothetical protein